MHQNRRLLLKYELIELLLLEIGRTTSLLDLGEEGKLYINYIDRYDFWRAGRRRNRGSVGSKQTDCQLHMISEKAERRWTYLAPNAKCKKAIDYVLTDARRILNDVSAVLFFNSGGDHCMLWERIHNNPSVEKRVLNVSSERKRSTD